MKLSKMLFTAISVVVFIFFFSPIAKSDMKIPQL